MPRNAGLAAVFTSLTTIIENCDRPTGWRLIRAISTRPNRITISDRFAPTRDSGATPTRSSDDELRVAPRAFAEPGRLLAGNMLLKRSTLAPSVWQGDTRLAWPTCRLLAVTPAQGSVENLINSSSAWVCFLCLNSMTTAQAALAVYHFSNRFRPFSLSPEMCTLVPLRNSGGRFRNF
jgi:hypothetical protein